MYEVNGISHHNRCVCQVYWVQFREKVVYLFMIVFHQTIMTVYTFTLNLLSQWTSNYIINGICINSQSIDYNQDIVLSIGRLI